MKNKIIILFIITVVIATVILFVFFKRPLVIELENGFSSSSIKTNDRNNVNYSYVIVTSYDEYNESVRNNKKRLNFNKYNYILLEVDRGSACDADIKIVSVSENNSIININYKLENVAQGCMRSSPRYFAIPINKKTDKNIDIILNKKE